MKILYALPTRLFFEEGPCGRVAHAKGFCSGVIANGGSIVLLAGRGAENFGFSEDADYIKVKSKNFIWYILFFIRLAFLRRNCDVTVLRWRPFLPFVLIPMGVFGRKVWLEVNSITGLYSKVALVRLIAKLSVFLAARLFKVIVVSEESRRVVASVSRKERAGKVIRNGFFPGPFYEFRPRVSSAEKFSVVYFGRKQDYYDWDMLYSAAIELNKIFHFDFHIFGFTDNVDAVNVLFYGEFDQEALVEGLTNIRNPILVLHASASDIARSGSPMKMFEYAATGIPCIVSDSLTEQSDSFRRFRYYSAGDKSDFMASLLSVKDNYTHEIMYAAESKKMALQNYTWDATVREWYAAL